MIEGSYLIYFSSSKLVSQRTLATKIKEVFDLSLCFKKDDSYNIRNRYIYI